MRLILLLGLAWASTTTAGILPSSPVQCELKNETDYGLVIVAASLPDSTVFGAPMIVDFVYKRHGTTALSEHDLRINRRRFLKAPVSDFPNFFGQVFVLSLKAGDYEFSNWGYYDQMNNHRSALGLGKLPFRVVPGRATYIGRFATTLWVGKNLLGMQEGRPWVDVVDERTHDLEVFAKKCPAIDSSTVDVQLLDPAPWRPRD